MKRTNVDGILLFQTLNIQTTNVLVPPKVSVVHSPRHHSARELRKSAFTILADDLEGRQRLESGGLACFEGLVHLDLVEGK